MNAIIDVEGRRHEIHERLKVREGILPSPAAPALLAPEARFLEMKRLEAYLNHHYFVFGQPLPVHRQGFKGKIEFFAKRLIRKLLRWYVKPQVDFNASVTRSVAECLRHFTVMVSELSALRGDIRRLEGQGQHGQTAESEPCEIEYYHRFEERFRGPRDIILDRQRQYLPLFAGCGPVLDIGCGRGEFLELLQEAGIDGRGVDVNPEMVAHCQGQGLKAVQADAFAHLESLPDGSLAGIYMAQVVEHLPPPRISKLLKSARDKLSWDGVLIAETPNPVCEPAMRTFWIDPTHIRPVHPELLRFLGEEAGFAFSHFVFTSALPGAEPVTKKVEGASEHQDVTSYRDYAIVLRRKY
jgi:SAM-dependent methyltransferase